MTFVDEIRKIQVKGTKVPFSTIEKMGDPAALAASFSNLKVEKEVKSIAAPRASDMYSSCMRKHVIGTVNELTEQRWTTLKGKIIFCIGNAVHFWLQNSSDLFGEERYGWWYCQACKQTRYFGKPPKRSCERCGADKDATIYLEHLMRLKKPVMVTGHPDMFFKPSHIKKVRIAELKTIAGDSFDKLVAPIIDHEWQIQTYMWGCANDSSIPIEIDQSMGYIVYVTKRTREEEFPLKIFPVVSNPDLIKRIKAKLMLYQGGLKDYPKNLPVPIDECLRGDFKGYRARTCVALKECVKSNA